MSRYKVYQIDHPDPKIVGRKMRFQVLIFAVLAQIIVLTFAFGAMIIKIKLVILFVAFLPLVIVIYFYLFYMLGSKNRRLKVIGTIEFTKTSIRKSIGDLIMQYDFKSIQKIELDKHLPVVEIRGNTGENFTYILRIIFFNSSVESFVISNLPADKKPNINIVQTLKTLRNFIKAEISIKT
jgi:hypothetical protein